MEPLIIKASNETPEVILDPQKEHYSIKGHSFPEDVSKYYLPVINWLKSNAKNIEHQICLRLDFDYINSASTKILMDVFTVLEEETKESENEATIYWLYDEDDNDNLDQGRFYEKLLNIKIYLEPKTDL
jgi:hypothetical protein